MCFKENSDGIIKVSWEIDGEKVEEDIPCSAFLELWEPLGLLKTNDNPWPRYLRRVTPVYS